MLDSRTLLFILYLVFVPDALLNPRKNSFASLYTCAPFPISPSPANLSMPTMAHEACMFSSPPLLQLPLPHRLHGLLGVCLTNPPCFSLMVVLLVASYSWRSCPQTSFCLSHPPTSSIIPTPQFSHSLAPFIFSL